MNFSKLPALQISCLFIALRLNANVRFSCLILLFAAGNCGAGAKKAVGAGTPSPRPGEFRLWLNAILIHCIMMWLTRRGEMAELVEGARLESE